MVDSHLLLSPQLSFPIFLHHHCDIPRHLGRRSSSHFIRSGEYYAKSSTSRVMGRRRHQVCMGGKLWRPTSSGKKKWHPYGVKTVNPKRTIPTHYMQLMTTSLLCSQNIEPLLRTSILLVPPLLPLSKWKNKKGRKRKKMRKKITYYNLTINEQDTLVFCEASLDQMIHLS